MKKPLIPKNEDQRINSLNSYNILDTLPERDYDEITQLVSEICHTPISLISLIDPDRQWFKSHHGLNATETPRDLAFCAHAILEPEEIFIINDAFKDDRFADNPLVTGNPNVVFYTGIPLVNPEGMALGTLCTIDHKPRELSVSQLNSLKILAHTVVNLMELRKSNISLQKTKKDLEERNKELEKFAYVISHDIKSPLINIMSFSGLLKTDYATELDENGIKYADYLYQSSQKLNTMVDGLLSYYRGERMLSNANETFNLAELIQSVVGLLDVQNDSKINYPKNNHSIKANKVVLEHILLNLLSNSIKYNDKKLIEINIDFYEDNNFYFFSVSDNGQGVEKEYWDKIFNLFSNLGNKDRFGNTGTGIGLSVVKKFVEAQGGKINFTSVVGQGTKVEFSLKKPK
jgi:signal transduction histidine kinase